MEARQRAVEPDVAKGNINAAIARGMQRRRGMAELLKQLKELG